MDASAVDSRLFNETGIGEVEVVERREFADSFDRLRSAVDEGCEGDQEWQARFVAGIRAAFAFAAANPAAARALTIESRSTDPFGDDEGDHRRLIEHFAEQLGRCAPPDRRLPASTDRGLITSIAAVVSQHLSSDRVDRLDEMASDMAYLALLPYVGFDEAGRWAARPMEAPATPEGYLVRRRNL
jgi:hypothetical protein